MTQHGSERSPARLMDEKLSGPLGAGQVGLIAAPPGVGKSALLVHIAVDALLGDQAVLHVAVKERIEHVRAHYDAVFRALSQAGQVADRAGAMIAAERSRMIHSYRDKTFDVDSLRRSLRMLADVAQFEPRLIVVDGLAVDALDALSDLQALATELKLPVWCTARLPETNTPVPDEAWETIERAVKLIPAGQYLNLVPLSGEGATSGISIALDPSTLLALDDASSGQAPVTAPRPADCTLYSGGANGSEAAFGEAAERWGVHEVNFTFDGHKQARATGRYELSPRELAAGDVSLVYVSRRLNRTYSEGSLIRRVLQTLWHMVSRSQQVFVIGQIQDDGTVVGGTGWSVELARMWNKDLWVYDQDQTAWFRWGGHDWVPGTPVIEAIHYTGTGTRYLTDDGRKAIDDLFDRSFRPRES